VRTTRLSPASFSLALRPGQARSVNLTRVGLYHYFDAAVDRATRIDDGNQIVVSPRKAPVRQGWIAVIPRAPGLHGSFVVPNGEDLFTPKMIVTIVGSAIVITNHDTDAHNFVVDPHSPTGGAFIIYGQDAEPPSGWQRLFVAQQPGLYHLYCTLHTKPIGKVGGWTLVAPRSPKASGFKDHNPMEAWVVVLPAETQ
jgi:plastocyanin